MATTLPYLASPGSIKTCLEKIKSAATPERVTQDFITTKLQIKGGTGAALIPYLKKIGFVASDGTPTELYKKYRNHATAGTSVAAAIKIGYKPLAQVNEYFYELNEKDLLALITQVTGAEEGNQVVKLISSTLKSIKSVANFEPTNEEKKQEPHNTNPHKEPPDENKQNHHQNINQRGLNFSYTINLNLPATTDQAVFNAIFRSLKEHLISENE